MPVTKNALKRYIALDKCFSNSGRRYSLDDLLQNVNDSLSEQDPYSTGISIRTLRYDIEFMRSVDGYDAPIEVTSQGRERFYRYSTRFSIHNKPINETEKAQIKSIISLMRSFEGRPEFEFLDTFGPLFADKFGDNENRKPIIGYETNLDYSGKHLIPVLFNAITNNRVVAFKYSPFTGEEYTVTCHPYYLKEFNNRWFLFGRNEELDKDIWNFPLDRIVSLNECDLQYKYINVNWEDYFDDIIGVTKVRHGELVDIELLFSKERAGYVKTKPLHLTQRDTENDNGTLNVRIQVIPNRELESLILSFGKNVKVIGPESFRESLKNHITEMMNHYE